MEKIEWTAPEHVHTEKSADWYWIVGIVSLSLAIIAIILDNLVFGLLIIVSGFTISLSASRRPEVIPHKIDTSGIYVDKVFHPYGEIEKFWVESNDAFPRIIIQAKKGMLPFTTILIHREDAPEIRRFIDEYLVEDKTTEPFFNKLLIYIGI